MEEIVVSPEYFKGYRIATKNFTRWHVFLNQEQRLIIVQHYFKEFKPYN